MHAIITHPSGPLHVFVACLEWEPEYQSDRLAQSHALARLASDPTLDGTAPVFVVGDLNAASDSPVMGPLTEVLSDAWILGGGDSDAVTLDSRHPFAPLEATDQIDRRIDYVLVRPGQRGQRITVDNARLADEPVAGVHPSDHRAVVCEVRWSPADQKR